MIGCDDICPRCYYPLGHHTTAGNTCTCTCDQVYIEFRSDSGGTTRSRDDWEPEDWADFRAMVSREQREYLMECIGALAYTVARRPAIMVFALAVIARTCRRKLLPSNRIGPWMKR